MNLLDAAPVEPGQAPGLEAMVEGLAKAASLPVPSLWIVPSAEPNAMAAGESPYVSAIGVTTGAISLLQPAELHSVIAHEVGHIASGHLADRTAQALKQSGMIGRVVGRSGNTVGRVVGMVHPVLGLGVRIASLGAMGYGNAKINEGFAVNRLQEAEADNFAHRFGLAQPFASTLVKLGRSDLGGMALPSWAHGLLFFGRPNLADHPPIPERIDAALSAPRVQACACPACWSIVQTGTPCSCGGPARTAGCSCGGSLDAGDRFCGTCGTMNPGTRCRLCGRHDERGMPNCEGCGFPLP